MGIRKNAKFLSSAERESFVKACVLMKADIVNPGAAPAAQYSRWDEYVAIHWMIQDAFAPGDSFVNFGHGGNGSYSFLSWHRYFLYQFEKQLQSYVPGVMLPYWDWTDPASVMTDTFLGPNGGIGNEVRRGYFARNAPGTTGNTTPAPTWWPAGLSGWILPEFFGTGAGALRRRLSSVSELPTAQDLRQTLAKNTYPLFQNALESGAGLTSPDQQMHNGMHGWIGGATGQMSDPAFSPFDPFFYLHHCNIDRLWAMWQMDGHANDYPTTGGQDNHRRADIMYPWTGGAAGYGTNASIASSIPMPDFSAVGAKRNGDTLDFRDAFGYTYDTLAVIGIGLDRTGSMLAMTPDPMTTSAPDVSKWEAAKRGVAAFLQDCETVQLSGVTYVMAGVETFSHLPAGNAFTPVFATPGYGLVKSGAPVSRASFDSNIGAITPGGSTPLADALLDVRSRLVEPPFGHVPADEPRYLAMLTDGLLTAGAPMSSIPDHSLGETVVFAMGFGTGADVDYATLSAMVAKGKAISGPQVFHGENPGTIDKFYSSALAQAIGFTTVIDPLVELFAGEHSHVEFQATSAEDSFLITAQGMDFDDASWSFHLEGPDGVTLYSASPGHAHDAGHGGPLPDVVATRSHGRLTLVVQRNNAPSDAWVGVWRLMVAYRAATLDAMVMQSLGDQLFPVSAGPSRGARFARLSLSPKARVAVRNVQTKAANRLDVRPVGTNRSMNQACSAVVNVYAKSRVRVDLRVDSALAATGALKVQVGSDVLTGNITTGRAFARLVAPTQDFTALAARMRSASVPDEARLKGSTALAFDPARMLAKLEREDPQIAAMHDQELPVLSHEGGPLHVHAEARVPGVHHLGVYVEGSYCPEHGEAAPEHAHDDAAHVHGAAPAGGASVCGPDCQAESWSRILTLAVAVGAKK